LGVGKKIETLRNKWKQRPLYYSCLFIIALQLCLLQFGIRGKVPIPDVEQGTRVQVQGTLYLRESKEAHQVLYLKDVSLYTMNQRLACANIILYDKEHIQVSLGNSIIATGDMYFFQSARNPGNFNQEEYYRRKNISGFISGANCEVNLQVENAWVIRTKLQELQEKWNLLFVRTLGEESGGIMSALLLGTRDNINPEIKELYQQSGIIHILSVSGLHISFIGVVLQKLLQKLRCKAFLCVGITSIVLGVYVIFVGAPISAIRAFFMYLMSVGAVFVRRVYDGKTSLALTAAMISLWRPLVLLEAGFLLSFGALVGIIVILPILQKIVGGMPKVLAGMYMGVAVHLALIPILLFYYFEWFPYSLLINFVVVPMIGVAMGIGLLGSGICLLWESVGEFILKGCHIILTVSEEICRWFIRWPGSSMVVGQPSVWRILLYYFVLVLACFLPQTCIRNIWKKRITLLVGIVIAHLCLCLYPRNTKELEIVMLDVGQGDGIFIKSPQGSTYFIDGGSNDINRVGRYRIEPFLKSKGVAVLDYVFISHGHADHMNGIMEMLERQEYGVKIRNIILPHASVHDEALLEFSEQARAQGTRVYTMGTGEQLSEGGFLLTCLQPDGSYSGELGNPSSMVLALQYGEFDMLFTGDLEGVGEEILTQALSDKAYEVLKVAHHGSKYSTEIAFLEKVRPSYALISSGIRNSYGHPHIETLERLEMFGSMVYRTSESGAITLRSNGYKMSVEEYLVF